MTADEVIEDIEDIEEDIVAIDVEVVEETGSLDGNSSIQETKKLVGVVVVSRDSMSYNFTLKVEKGSIENKVKGIVYSHFAYYSNYSCYSKMEMSPRSYLGFEATKASFVQ